MYDFVVVGAGSAGCVLANRLSADGASVCLLEAGGPDDNALIRTPGLFSALQDTVYDWGYRSVPQPELNGRRIFCPRGRVLGGSSSINFMMYVRGNRGDYDHWARLGNAGWSFDEVFPYFLLSERNERFGAPYHGTNGLLSVRDPAKFDNRLWDVFFEAAAEFGLAFNDDPNGATQDGACNYQATIGPKGRASTSAAFLEPVRSRPNLTVKTSALVSKILFEGNTAVGVQYLDAEGLHVVHAGETILSGGAINSPQLLLLSGIGPAKHLAAVGVEVRRDLPGVGENLQDHFNVNMRFEIDEPWTLFGMSADAAAEGMRAFGESGTGPFAGNFLGAGGYLHCDPSSEYPDVQFFFVTGFGADFNDGRGTDRHGFNLGGYTSRPLSRGTIRLASANPFDRPLIDPRYLSDGRDLALSVATLREFRRLGKASAFARIGGREMRPGPDADTDEALITFVRNTGNTTWHQSCTCKMGIDDLAVVDPSLRVHGIDRLRIVDASVMPAVPSCNTNAPVIMIAEKAADMILGRAALPPVNLPA